MCVSIRYNSVIKEVGSVVVLVKNGNSIGTCEGAPNEGLLL